jgi:hypothetical protein
MQTNDFDMFTFRFELLCQKTKGNGRQTGYKKGLSLNTPRGYLSSRLFDKKIIFALEFFDLAVLLLN